MEFPPPPHRKKKDARGHSSRPNSGRACCNFRPWFFFTIDSKDHLWIHRRRGPPAEKASPGHAVASSSIPSVKLPAAPWAPGETLAVALRRASLTPKMRLFDCNPMAAFRVRKRAINNNNQQLQGHARASIKFSDDKWQISSSNGALSKSNRGPASSGMPAIAGVWIPRQSLWSVEKRPPTEQIASRSFTHDGKLLGQF